VLLLAGRLLLLLETLALGVQFHLLLLLVGQFVCLLVELSLLLLVEW